MGTLGLNTETLQRLQERAAQEGCSPDDLIDRLLNAAPKPHANILYDTLVNHSSDIIVVFDLELRYQHISPIIEKLTGVPTHLIIGKTNAEMGMSLQEVAFWKEAWKEVIESGQEQVRNYTMQTTLGLRQFEARLTPVFDASGTLINLLSINRDITERQEALKALRQSEERYRLLTEIMSDYALSVAVLPDGSKYVEWIVGAFEEITGHPKDIYSTDPRLTFIHPDDQERVHAEMSRTMKEGVPTISEYRVRNKDGDYIWLRLSRIPIFDEAHEHVVRFYAAGQNITERKLAEEALRLSEERYRIVSELISDYAFSYYVDKTGELLLEWNTESFIHLTGYQPEETATAYLYGLYHTEDRDRVRADVEKVLQGEEITGVYRIITKTGQVRWLRVYRRPIFDDIQQRVVRFYGIAQDVTVQRKAEAFALEQQRLKANLKKEKELNGLIQRMISSLSHDIRTPLTVISNVKEILMNYNHRLTEEMRREKLAIIDKQLRFVLEMLDDLSNLIQNNYSHQTAQHSEVDIASLCQLSIEEIRTVNTQALKIHLINEIPIETMIGDETLLSRILLNLLSNAVKFSPPDGHIWLELGRDEEWVILRVTDQGIGIDPKEQTRIFEPFFRASNTGSIKGTGLGLSIVHECVKRHGGQISVESKQGEGTHFTVRLPGLPAYTEASTT